VSASASPGPERDAWRVGAWGPLGWIETTLKAAGVAVGIVALALVLGDDADWASGVRLVQAIVLGVLSLGLLAAIGDRVAEREIVGMIFIPLMCLGHLAMLIAVAWSPDAGGYLLAFAFLMLAGDLVKLVFLRTTGFRVRRVAPAVVYGLTSAYVAGYIALLLLEAAR
jgi:hypothetical protein